MNKINYGNIWYKERWGNIFEYLTSKKYNPYKSWWIEKVYIDEASDKKPVSEISGHCSGK